MPERTVIHIDLDTFFVSVERVLNPGLEGKPVVVGGRPDQRGVVATASYEARVFGLYSGMPMVTAVRLCPQAVFLEGSFARYREFSDRFMAILGDFSPFIEPLGIDEAFLDATGFESLHGSIRQMAVSIKQRIRNEVGLCASIGIAGCKVVAKVASDLSKPDGLMEVMPGEESAFLSPLPVEKLPGAGKHSVQVLKALGVQTIGELAGTRVSVLKSRLGAAGEMLHQMANGVDNRQVSPPGEAKSISRETTFGQDTRDRAFLEATLWAQSEKVGADLRRKGMQARCVTIKVRFGDFSTITRSHTLRDSVDTDRAIFETGAGLLEQALHSQGLPVRLIGIGVSNLGEGTRQTTLFEAPDQKSGELNRAIDSIRQKYGFGAIRTGWAIRPEDV